MEQVEGMDAIANPNFPDCMLYPTCYTQCNKPAKVVGPVRQSQLPLFPMFCSSICRSLAALAGERDRALRSLAAEEDRRRDMIEELTSLLGGELSCGDVSRLAMGLERIEREAGPAAASEEEGDGGQERGRAWVLEQLRQCLFARVAVQDQLRSSADEIAADMFESEEGLMGFQVGPGGGQDAEGASPISRPPPPADVAVAAAGPGADG
ncbi:unnamed protein product, partial [Ectocarpus sp. 13 AM-2016]